MSHNRLLLWKIHKLLQNYQEISKEISTEKPSCTIYRQVQQNERLYITLLVFSDATSRKLKFCYTWIQRWEEENISFTEISVHFTSCTTNLKGNKLSTMEVIYKIPKSILNYLLTNPSVLSIFSVFTFLYTRESKGSHDLVMLRKKSCLWFAIIIKVKLNNLSLPQNKAILWHEKSHPNVKFRSISIRIWTTYLLFCTFNMDVMKCPSITWFPFLVQNFTLI